MATEGYDTPEKTVQIQRPGNDTVLVAPEARRARLRRRRGSANSTKSVGDLEVGLRESRRRPHPREPAEPTVPPARPRPSALRPPTGSLTFDLSTARFWHIMCSVDSRRN